MSKFCISVAVFVCFAVFGTAAAQDFGPAVVQGQDITVGDMTTADPLPPVDIYRPGGGHGPRHVDLAIFAWLEFIALSAPVSTDSRGDVDNRGIPGGSFADSGSGSGGGVLVWESYAHRAEVFPHEPNVGAGGAVSANAPPQAFNENPPVYYYQSNVDNLNQYAVVPDKNEFNNLDEGSQIGMNEIFYPNADSEGEAYQILFEAKANEVMSNYTRDHQSNPLALEIPANFTAGTIETKAAWISTDAIAEEDLHRYWTSEAVYYEVDEMTGEFDPQTGTFALLGLHIIHKTPNYPTFIFATFEHEDLLNDTGVYYEPTYSQIHYEVNRTVTLNAPFADSFSPRLANPFTNPVIPFDTANPIAMPNGIPVALPKPAEGATYVGVGEIPLAHQFGSMAPAGTAAMAFVNGTTSGSTEVTLDPTVAPDGGALPTDPTGSILAGDTISFAFYPVTDPTTIPPTVSSTTTIPGTRFVVATGDSDVSDGGTITFSPALDFDIPAGSHVNVNVQVPVTQPDTTNSMVTRANLHVLTAMEQIPGFDENFVWQYYFLKGVQGVPTSRESANDYYLANAVIESSQPGIQLFRGGQGNKRTLLTNTRSDVNVIDPAQGNAGFSVGGCMGCHGVAQTLKGQDFSFLLNGKTGLGFLPDAIGSGAEQVVQEREAFRNLGDVTPAESKDSGSVQQAPKRSDSLHSVRKGRRGKTR